MRRTWINRPLVLLAAAVLAGCATSSEKLLPRGEHTMLDLAERALRLTGSRSRLVFRPLPQDDPRRRCPDITRARTLLGWQPEVSLDDGLQRTIHHFRGVLGAQQVTVA